MIRSTASRSIVRGSAGYRPKSTASASVTPFRPPSAAAVAACLATAAVAVSSHRGATSGAGIGLASGMAGRLARADRTNQEHTRCCLPPSPYSKASHHASSLRRELIDRSFSEDGKVAVEVGAYRARYGGTGGASLCLHVDSRTYPSSSDTTHRLARTGSSAFHDTLVGRGRQTRGPFRPS